MDTKLRYPGNWKLNSDEEGVLRLFLERIEECKAYGSFGYPVEATIRVDMGEVSSEAELPHEILLRSASMAARHFHMEESPVQLYKVCKLLYRTSGDGHFQAKIAEIRSDHSNALRKELNPSTSAEDLNTRNDLINVYFNGDFFHSDPEKRRFARDQSAPFAPLFKQQFAQALYDLIRRAERLATIAENALGIDQLATCPTSKQLQAKLQQHGLAPRAITIGKGGDHAFNPPKEYLYVRVDKPVADAVVASIVEEALDLLARDHPGFSRYEFHYTSEQGDYTMIGDTPYREWRGQGG